MSHDDDDRQLIVLADVLTTRRENVVAGSVQVPAQCGCTCWISPAALQFQLSPAGAGAELLCLAHAMKEANGKMPEPKLMPGQRDELRRELGAEEADRFLRQLRLGDQL